VATTGLHRHLYTVVKGDTLIKIAHKFKTTATAIMAENSITDPAKLAIGKKLKIPSEESRSARISAPASRQPVQAQAKENAPSGQLANFVP
jgi:LysM repeat protein